MNGEAQEIAPSLSQSQFMRIAFEALSRRAARWLTLTMSFVLFGAAIWWPDWRRLVAATAFTILVNTPLWWRKE